MEGIVIMYSKANPVKKGKIIFTKDGLIAAKKARLKKRRLRLLISSTIFITFIFCSVFFSYKAYINNKCKNIQLAVDYHLTHISDDKVNLLRVKNFDIITLDKNYIHIQAFGLTKKKPHKEIKVDAEFIKDPNGVWNLIQSSKVTKN